MAVVLRILRGIVRWHEDAWLYSVYPAETLDLLRSGAVLQVPFTFTGLHPPAWPVLHSLTELLDPRPLWWLVESTLLSTIAVWLVARRSPVAGLLLATAPVAVHYSAEVNQYALLTCALAGLWATRTDPTTPTSRGVVAWGLLAAWTHILGAIAATIAAISLPPPQRKRTTTYLALGMAPLAIGILQAAGDTGTFTQPPFTANLVLSDLFSRFGALGLVLPPLAAFGAKRSPRLALATLTATATIAAFVALRVAAPHQFPYLLTVLPPLVLLAASVPWAARILVPVALLQGTWQAAFDLQRLHHIHTDLHTAARAVDTAFDQLHTPWTCPTTTLDPSCSGDALVLLRPPGRNDDDKTRFSPVLWRIPPWWSAPRIVLPQVPLRSSDHRYGQPRLVTTPRGRFAVYVHDQPRPTLADLPSLHARALLVVSDTGAHSDFLRQTERHTGTTTTTTINPLDHLIAVER